MKDTNDNYIFEKDIIEYCDFNSLRSGGHKGDNVIIGSVKFVDGMYVVEEDNGDTHDLFEVIVNDEELKITGNTLEF